MNSIEILSKLESVNFTAEQAKTVTGIFEDYRSELATKEGIKTIKEDMKMIVASEVSKAKYDLVKWIVGGIIANGAIATLLKFFA